MSLVISVYVPTGIALSCDSRTTLSTTQEVNDPKNIPNKIIQQTHLTLSDATEKIFLVHDRFGVGTFGDAIIKNLPVGHFVEQFIASLDKEDFIKVEPLKTEHFASKLLAYFRELDPDLNIVFIVVGYDEAEPWVISIDVKKNTTQRNNLDGAKNVTYGILRGGDTSIVNRILSDPQALPPFQIMNLQDAVDFSRHLIRSTVDQLRFEPRFAAVGGPIDTLVITYKGAKFLVHKALTVS